MKIIITGSAERDLREAADFYEKQEPRAGAHFTHVLMEGIRSLAQLAGIHRQQWGYHRAAVQRSFPYAIFYFIREGTVFDCRRNPNRLHRSIAHRKNEDDEF